MNIANQIGGQQQTVRQFQIVSLVPHPQIGGLCNVWLLFDQVSYLGRGEKLPIVPDKHTHFNDIILFSWLFGSYYHV